MGKHVFPVMVLLVLLAGCRFERAGSATPVPEEYLTALEAYEQIRPAMLAWHGDAVAINVDSLPDEDPERRIQRNGRAPVWVFTIISLEALKGTHIYWRSEEVTVGSDGIPGNEGPIEPKSRAQLFTIENVLIDSDEAAHIALQDGSVRSDYMLIQVHISQFNSRNHAPIPPSWEMTYMPQDSGMHDVLAQKMVYIDVVTGEVLWSDFAEP
ncbi:MAG: hypothetical protein ACPL4I_13025 [Bacteroidota bacterium]